jgi:hypothetical protein
MLTHGLLNQGGYGLPRHLGETKIQGGGILEVLRRRTTQSCAQMRVFTTGVNPFGVLGGWCFSPCWRGRCLAPLPLAGEVGAVAPGEGPGLGGGPWGQSRQTGAPTGATVRWTWGPQRRQATPRTASRARFTAAASRAKSHLIFSRPRMRARRQPCLRRIRWPILRSTLGLVAR